MQEINKTSLQIIEVIINENKLQFNCINEKLIIQTETQFYDLLITS